MNIKSVIKTAVLFCPVTRGWYVSRYCKKTKLENDIWGGEKFSDAIEEAFSVYLTKEHQIEKKLSERLKKDIVYCWLRYQAKPYEYFLYHFETLTHRLRKEYLVDAVKDQTLIRVDGLEKFVLLKDKYKCYQKFKKFYKREACRVTSETDKEKFFKFIECHPQFMAKPMRGGVEEILIYMMFQE